MNQATLYLSYTLALFMLLTLNSATAEEKCQTPLECYEKALQAIQKDYAEVEQMKEGLAEIPNLQNQIQNLTKQISNLTTKLDESTQRLATAEAKKPDFDSGWRPDNQTTGEGHLVKFEHKLRDPPKQITLWFTDHPESKTAFPILWSWAEKLSGNPVTVEVNDREIILSISHKAPLHGVWTPQQGWKIFNSGFWRVYAWQ